MKPIRLLLLFALASPAPAADHPADTLLKLVPDDTAVCVVIRDLRGHSTRLAESPFAAWLAKSPLGQQLGGEDGLKKMVEAQKLFAGMLGVTPEQILDDVLGDAVVFAFTPGPADKPEAERTLLLIKPKTPAVLAGLLTRIDKAQLSSGELTAVTPKTHNGKTYSHRQKKDSGAEYYTLADGVFAFSSDEGVVKSVLNRLASTASTSRAAASLAKLNAGHSLITVWLHPRSFDADFAAKVAAAANPHDRHGIATAASIWKGVTDAAVLIDLDEDLKISLAARFDPAELPAAFQSFLVPKVGGSALASVVPESAILAVLGRAKTEPLLALADALTPPAVSPRPREQFERDLGPVVGKANLPAVLEALGPDWGFWAVAPEKGAGWAPEWTLAIKVGPAKPGQPDPAKAMLSAADSAAQLIRVAYNQAHTDEIDLREDTIGGLTVKSLANDRKFPSGFRPAYTMKGAYFVLASSPEVVGKFQAPSESAVPADADAVVKLSASRLRTYLAEHKEQVANTYASLAGKPAAEVRTDLDKFLALLEPFDSADIRLTSKDNVTRITLRLKTVKPLKK